MARNCSGLPRFIHEVRLIEDLLRFIETYAMLEFHFAVVGGIEVKAHG